ncbi:hypothetical protein Adi01nite_45470 [Amorphoplanes digitatis]|nr:hypothetical protein Adi01nite_45470 [Actinoplanes digitatis]
MPIRSPSEPPPALPNSLCKPSAAVLMSGNVTGESRGGQRLLSHRAGTFPGAVPPGAYLEFDLGLGSRGGGPGPRLGRTHLRRITEEKLMSEPQEIVETRGDDRVDLLTGDTNGDGRPDVWVSDTDGDGKADLFQFDTDGDGKVDITMVDLDEDGTPDKVVDGDGGLPPAV